jgi:hypothetical protein
VGTRLQAGKLVELTGGPDPVEAGVPYSGNGILLYGSTQISTWRPGSEIRVNGPGKITLLAPEFAEEIKADSFIATANGRLASDVKLHLWLDKIGWEITSTVTIPASSTSTNTSIQDLMADIQNAINAAQWTVTKSDNAAHPVGSSYTSSGTVKDLNVGLSQSRLLLAGPYEFELRSTSVNAQALGWTTLASGHLKSSLPWALYAPQSNSVVTIGAPAGPNGKLSIAGKVLADKAINLYSGEDADGVSLDLTVTGLLETRSGSINLSPGATSVMYGDVVAGGTGSDITVTAWHGQPANLRDQLHQDSVRRYHHTHQCQQSVCRQSDWPWQHGTDQHPAAVHPRQCDRSEDFRLDRNRHVADLRRQRCGNRRCRPQHSGHTLHHRL